MQQQWQSLISSLPSPLEQHQVSPELGYVACLTGFEYLAITGADRHTFLQGQMSCDFTKIEGQLLLGANCNLKGRALATFYAMDDGETTYLILPTGQALPLKAVLDKYALFSNAEITLPTQPQLVVGLVGEPAVALCETKALEENQAIVCNAGMVARISNTNLHICITSSATVSTWLTALPNEALPTQQQTWDQQQLSAGISHVTPESQELFIPQELNYDLIGGISFNKGCYKGQEIIARLHYRGTYKQRAFRYECSSDHAPIAGTPLFSSNSKQPCGHVIQSVLIAPGKVELLAVNKIKVQESEPVHLDQKDGPILQSLSLPYAITNTEEAE
ncbi:hypothetical protein A9Q99_21790 [Gammaproteobacteria bacterium 45_16_T64]|nr:hypothetical protein A9Q99_21790 [Gammaproteobacteria bacterium 45_16_T64]